jgi:hypothetical protein
LVQMDWGNDSFILPAHVKRMCKIKEKQLAELENEKEKKKSPSAAAPPPPPAVGHMVVSHSMPWRERQLVDPCRLYLFHTRTHARTHAHADQTKKWVDPGL